MKCNLCQTDKPATEFYKQRDGKIRAGCKSCRCSATRRSQRGRYQKDPAAAMARHKRWQAAHPDQHREIMRKAVARQRRQKREAGTPPLFATVTSAAPSAQLRENCAKCGIELVFDRKPDFAVLDTLRKAWPLWQWSRTFGVWYAKDTPAARELAQQFLETVSTTPAQPTAAAPPASPPENKDSTPPAPGLRGKSPPSHE